jgi:ABC-type phosphate transport system substrate-binding protein
MRSNHTDPNNPRVHYFGFQPFRDNFALCGDVQEVIDEVARDRNAIGFIAFTGRLPKEVRALPLAEKPDAPYVAPRLEPVPQKEYPLSTPILLHVHPSASQTTREFAQWAASSAGAEILAKVAGDDASVTSPATTRPDSPASGRPQPTSGMDRRP